MSKDNEIRVFGQKGLELNSQLSNQEIKKSDLPDDMIDIFNAYNQNGDDELDSEELSVFFDELKSVSKNIDIDKDKKSLQLDDVEDPDCRRVFRELLEPESKDSTLRGNKLAEFSSIVIPKNSFLDPYEIRKLLREKKLDKKLKIGDVLNFLDILEVKSKVKDLSGLSCNGKTEKALNSISTQNVADVFSKYSSVNGKTIFNSIAHDRWSFGSTREDYINIVKTKLIENARLMGIDTKDFETKFDKELKNIDMTWLSTYDTKELDRLANDLIKQINSRKTHYQKNRNGIATMMADIDLCWTDDDKYELLNNIYQYSASYSPERMMKSIKKDTTDPKVKRMLSQLEKSKYLEYYPIYIASIIAQESRFRTKDKEIFTNNGQGVMQLTKIAIDDLYERKTCFDNGYMEPILKQYKTSEDLYDAIKSPENAELNLRVANIFIGGLMNMTLGEIKRGDIPKEFKNIKMDSPEAFMEYVALRYNANKEVIGDEKYNGKPSQYRYIYGREVLQRFKKFTPSDVKVNRYFEYVPDKKDFVNR